MGRFAGIIAVPLARIEFLGNISHLMALLDTLEYRLGRFAISGITRIMAMFQLLVFVLLLLDPYFINWLVLDPKAVTQGQVWRLVSYLFIPWTMSPIFILFQLAILWMIGDALENAWGAFRLNLFILVGMLALTLTAFFLGSTQTNIILLSSLFLAFATLFPEVEFLIFFILPVKVKWLALIAVGLLFFSFIGGGISTKASIVAGVANYLLFFGPNAIREAFFKGQVAARRRRYEAAVHEPKEEESLHRCKICGRTENSDPSLDFRISKDGDEYCMEHLPGKSTA